MESLLLLPAAPPSERLTDAPLPSLPRIAELAESSVRYELTLQNFSKILLNVYIVYSVPVYSEKTADGKDEFKWKLVKRKYCKRGCKGPILRSIQRFGKLGRRCSEIWSSTNFQQVHQEQTAMQSPQGYGGAKKEDAKKGPSKNHKSLFISIDEACTHVSQGDKKCRFRLLFGVTDAETGEKIGAAVSAPIRVLANNDAPNGAAYIHMPIPLANSWKGWKGLVTRRDLGLPLDVDLAPTTPDSAHPETRLDGKRKIDRLPIAGGVGPGANLPLKKRTKQTVESPQNPQNLSPIEQARASMTSAMTVPMAAAANLQSPPGIAGLQMQQNPFLLSPANIQNLHQMMYFYNLAAMAAAGGNPGGLN